nr:MAG TPA: hypothetical protein [Bacteriophage sp.]
MARRWLLSCGRHYPARPDRQRGQGDLGDLRQRGIPLD